MNPVTIASLLEVLTTAKHDAQKPHRTMRGVISWLAAELTAFQQQAPADRFMISCIQDRACEDFRFKRDFIAQLENEIDALNSPPAATEQSENDKVISAIVDEEMQRNEKTAAAERYFSNFRRNVNDLQLTRFENAAYKLRQAGKKAVFGPLMLWTSCELVARRLEDFHRGTPC